MAALSMHEQLLLLSDGTWARTRGRLEGLTDDELLWEPVPGCWTVRQERDGQWVGDWAMPAPAVPPFTTIGWRMLHLIGCYGSERNSRWVGVEVPQAAIESWTTPAPHTAAEAIAVLERAHARWRAVLEAADDDLLAELIGPMGGQYADAPRAGLLIHQLDEVIHHAAEIAVLRDLYRSSDGPADPDPAVAALLTSRGAPAPERLDALDPATATSRLAELGRWDLVEAALDHGLPADGPAPTALHRAAGLGRTRLVERLLAGGADPTVRDPQFRATPAEWADFFGHPSVAALLDGSNDP